MNDSLRVVADTNIVLSAKKSNSSSSPNREFFQLAGEGKFTMLYTTDILNEYIEKLAEHGISPEVILDFILLLMDLAEEIQVLFFHLDLYPTDMDDVMFLLCALNGKATHLVSYYDHLLSLNEYYRNDLTICTILNFLAVCRNTPS